MALLNNRQFYVLQSANPIYPSVTFHTTFFYAYYLITVFSPVSYTHLDVYKRQEHNTEDRTETVQNQHSNQNENREEGVSPHLN